MRFWHLSLGELSAETLTGSGWGGRFIVLFWGGSGSPEPWGVVDLGRNGTHIQNNANGTGRQLAVVYGNGNLASVKVLRG